MSSVFLFEEFIRTSHFKYQLFEEENGEIHVERSGIFFSEAKNKTDAATKGLFINHFSSFKDAYSMSKIAGKDEEKVGKQMENWREKMEHAKRPSVKNYTRRMIFFCWSQKWIMDILSKLLTVIGFFSVIVNGGDYVCREGGRFLLLPPNPNSSFFSEGRSLILKRLCPPDW